MTETTDTAGSQALAPVDLARVAVLVFGGLIAAGALFIGTLIYVGGVLVSGERFDTEDLVGIPVFGLLSLVIAWRGSAAAARVRRGRTEGESLVWLARIAPVLLVLGGIAGGAAMYSIQRGHVRAIHEDARALCRKVGHDDDRACEAIAVRCLGDARNARVDGTSGAHYQSDDPMQQPEVLCVDERLRK